MPLFVTFCKAVKMIWTRAQLEHDWFIPKDIWRILTLKVWRISSIYNDRFNVLLCHSKGRTTNK